MKQVKWNKKRKWANTRYCKPFKVREASRVCNAAMVAAGAQLQLSSIASRRAICAHQRVAKAMSIVSVTLDSIKSIDDELSKGGER